MSKKHYRLTGMVKNHCWFKNFSEKTKHTHFIELRLSSVTDLNGVELKIGKLEPLTQIRLNVFRGDWKKLPDIYEGCFITIETKSAPLSTKASGVYYTLTPESGLKSRPQRATLVKVF